MCCIEIFVWSIHNLKVMKQLMKILHSLAAAGILKRDYLADMKEKPYQKGEIG